MKNDIVKTTTSQQTIEVTLANGVSVALSFNNEYVNVHFSGIDHHQEGHWLEVSPLSQNGRASNYVNIHYKSKSDN